MLAEKSNLDVASAMKIARGQIARISDSISARAAGLPIQMPTKRLAWLREAENLYRRAYAETLIGIQSEKRRVIAMYLMPLAEQFEGWLSIEVAVASFGGVRNTFVLAALSEQAIARLMEGLKTTDAIAGLRGELSESILVELLQCVLAAEKHELIYVATAAGCFVAKWNAARHSYIVTTWLSERLATDRERSVLDRLRCEQRLGLGPSLSECA